MAGIRTAIELQDNFSSVLYHVIDSVNIGISAMEDLYQTMDSPVDMSSLAAARDSINQAAISVMELSEAMQGTDRYICDNVEEQRRFNREIGQGTQEANELMQTIKGVVAAYATTQTFTGIMGLSDQLTSTMARLELMNDQLQSIDQLNNMIYQSAQRSRGSYLATADAVSKMGLMAGDAFNSSAEVIAFTEQLNKHFRIAGTEAAGIDAAMLQITQAMSSGVLRGEEYNSVMEQAPTIIQAIADYLHVPIGKLKDMAAEGQLTADVVKNALFDVAEETDAKFNGMSMTFSEIWGNFQNDAVMAFQPVLERINKIANSEPFQGFVDTATQGLFILAGIAQETIDLLVSGASWVSDNWSWLSPVILGVAGALAVYYGWQLAVNAIGLISKGIHVAMAAAQMIHAAATGALTATTVADIAAQNGLNAAMYACPITWIVIGVIALIAALFALCQWIAKVTGIANSGFSIITGGINVVIQFLNNLNLVAANIAMGIGEAMGALASNMMAAFHNAISSVQSWFYGLLSTAMSVIAGICEALNKLPFVEFDYSGVISAADEYAAKAAESAGDKEGYQSISDAFRNGFSRYDAFQEGWATDAFNKGAAWGDGVTERISGLFDHSPFYGEDNAFHVEGYRGSDGIGNGLDGIGGGVGNIADNTGRMAESMELTGEELKYLRDIAEQEAINRFTTAEITIEQTNHNSISSGLDLDDIVSGLDDALGEAIEIMTEGVHV